MSKPADETCTVQVELPVGFVDGSPADTDALAKELRELWVLEHLREHHLSQGKAAELLNLPLADLLDLMGKHNISPFDYSPGELQDELRSLA
jgi:predicted HTH domain antitoxin